MDLKKQMDEVYRALSLDRIPWNMEHPPELLVELVETKEIVPCKAVDLGCGAGNYAVWLATKGFQMTGVDLSPRAIALAEQLAAGKSVSCRFIAENLAGDAVKLAGPFDFAFDWEVLHHVFPEDRERYARNVHRVLRTGARYLSVCFSESDPDFGGEGKYRKTPLGTTLYFSSEQELHDLFTPLFDIQEISTVSVEGKYGPHRAVKAFMKRRDS